MDEVNPVVIVAASRTPLGRFRGNLSSVSATDLGAQVIQAVIERSGLGAEQIDEGILGCVLTAGVGQAPARQALRAAGLSDAVGATTINKVCGSGMKAAMIGHDLLLAGSANIVLCGGMESMSNAPYLLPAARGGYRMGHNQVVDHMLLDGLEDAYERGRSMGDFGEAAAERYGFDREQQDDYAIETLMRARNAIESHAFADEITPVTVLERGESKVIAQDEHPMKVSPERIRSLKPAFRQNGTITAASASANSDGAAAMVLTRRLTAEREGLPILATIRGHATFSHAPAWYTTAPIPAIRKLLNKVNWQTTDVDLYEINEAFAVVAMAAARDLAIPRDRLNVNGGACALGHPIGATGARLIVTLVHALRRRGLQRGVAALCIGGGEATAFAVEV
ncbi:acetyl-CoA acetyltransferase [Pandoraea capi]|uniref:Acetyl-CoA acetyltransferase n=1 Tax=Pandoraea capi TaxID=2508286 RepID=A0ABY6W7B2_9BURK|nr:acetyl-CoA C-acyltransferase [Pandoraea capi]VVE34882.1 acetyl-CoA acetyltransferase [Pandoraea capi]